MAHWIDSKGQIVIEHQTRIEFYRPAGYDYPEANEQYVSKDGKIKVAQAGATFDGVRFNC